MFRRFILAMLLVANLGCAQRLPTTPDQGATLDGTAVVASTSWRPTSAHLPASLLSWLHQRNDVGQPTLMFVESVPTNWGAWDRHLVTMRGIDTTSIHEAIGLGRGNATPSPYQTAIVYTPNVPVDGIMGVDLTGRTGSEFVNNVLAFSASRHLESVAYIATRDDGRDSLVWNSRALALQTLGSTKRARPIVAPNGEALILLTSSGDLHLFDRHGHGRLIDSRVQNMAWDIIGDEIVYAKNGDQQLSEVCAYAIRTGSTHVLVENGPIEYRDPCLTPHGLIYAGKAKAVNAESTGQWQLADGGWDLYLRPRIGATIQLTHATAGGWHSALQPMYISN